MHIYETILLAEDNADHALLIQCALHKAGLLNPVQVVPDGLEAISYLEGFGKYGDRDEFPFPGLLLLDLFMPNKNGFEVMQWIKGRREFSRLRIVVLTTSDKVYNMREAYQAGADSFLIKPVDFRDFVQLGTAVRGFWAWFGAPPPGANIPPRDMPLFTQL